MSLDMRSVLSTCGGRFSGHLRTGRGSASARLIATFGESRATRKWLAARSCSSRFCRFSFFSDWPLKIGFGMLSLRFGRCSFLDCLRAYRLVAGGLFDRPDVNETSTVVAATRKLLSRVPKDDWLVVAWSFVAKIVLIVFGVVSLHINNNAPLPAHDGLLQIWNR